MEPRELQDLFQITYLILWRKRHGCIFGLFLLPYFLEDDRSNLRN